MMESNSNTSKYLYLSRLTSLICFPSGNSIPSVQTIFPLFSTSTTHLSRPNPDPHGLDKRIQFSLSLHRHTGIPGPWTQELDAGLWTLDSGRWTLDAGHWTLDAGLWMLDSGLWMLDSELWTLDSGRFFDYTNKHIRTPRSRIWIWTYLFPTHLLVLQI